MAGELAVSIDNTCVWLPSVGKVWAASMISAIALCFELSVVSWCSSMPGSRRGLGQP